MAPFHTQAHVDIGYKVIKAKHLCQLSRGLTAGSDGGADLLLSHPLFVFLLWIPTAIRESGGVLFVIILVITLPPQWLGINFHTFPFSMEMSK